MHFMVTTITNPVLTGFHPDPSAIRVGKTYYVATSTFEWYPGVEILSSENLRDWHTVSRPLMREAQLDMRGEAASCGIWAPNLSYYEGVFYLVYTDMKNAKTPIKDLDNYLVTAKDIKGPWSEPIYLNSSGFDPALFHDEDGRAWLINLTCDFRPGKNRFGGIWLQEYDQRAGKLVGETVMIDPPRSLREGSNLYKIDGWYYLMIAEGGTGVEHSTVISRSRTITGPYEDMPGHFLMTSRYAPFHPIQCAGHSSLIDTPDGKWYILHLGTRPLPSTGASILGRECFLQKLERDKEGWFHLAFGGILPSVETEAPFPLDSKSEKKFWHYDAKSGMLDSDFFVLRESSALSLFDFCTRKGWLRLYGRRSLFSSFTQALAARRVSHFSCRMDTHMEYLSTSPSSSAGLVALYDQENFIYLTRSFDEDLGEVLKIAVGNNGSYTESDMIAYGDRHIHLRMELQGNKLYCFYSRDGVSYQAIGGAKDATILCGEHCRISSFTGAMVGICCQDLAGTHHAADYKTFDYTVIDG